MLNASWAGDLQGLTPLIVAILAAVGVFHFRREIKQVAHRLTKIEARRKDTSLVASMEDSVPEQPPDAAGVPAEESPQPDESEADAISATSTGAADADDLRGRMVRAYLDGDKKEADRLSDGLASVEADPIQLRRDQVLRHSAGFIGGIDPNGLDELEKRTGDPDIGYYVYRMIGACLTATEKPAEAVEALQKSLELSNQFGEKVKTLAMKAEALIKIGEQDQAVEELGQMLYKAPDDRRVLEELWHALAGVYKSQGELELHATAVHRVAELAGNNASKWFRAAFAYSEVEADHLTIPVVQCYRMCLFFDSDHEYAKNNLGVLLQRQKMPILAASHYEAAAKLGNTLAMGNLAQNYLRAGFVEDAEAQLRQAEERPSQDEKVASVKAEIASDRSDENKRFESLSDAGSRAGEFLTRYVRARTKPSDGLSTEWFRNEQAIEVVVKGDEFLAAWSVGSYRGGRRFRGTRCGAALVGAFETEGSSVVGGDPTWKNDGQGYGVISDDGRQIELLKLEAETTEYLRLSAGPPLQGDET